MSNSPDMEKILPILDDVYEEYGAHPLRMAFFWENVLRHMDEELRLILKNGDLQFKPANIVNISGKYETFLDHPNNTMYVRRVGQKDSHMSEFTLGNFRKSLLLAFIAPLASDKNRFYIIHPKYEYKDMDEGSVPQNSVPIERNFLLSGVTLNNLNETNIKKVIERINEWAGIHSVPDNVVYFRKRVDSQVNLYTRLTNALGKDDLARISLPLDIVDKLMKVFS